MASGKTHLRVEAAAGVLLGGVWMAAEPVRELLSRLAPQQALMGFAAGYVFSMIWLSPDLDLEHCDARRRWGPLGFLWKLYPKLFSHRGLSHDLLVGTATRLAYLIAAAAVAGAGPAWAAIQGGWVDPAALPWGEIRAWTPAMVGFVLGCWPPNAIHTLVDSATPRGSQS